MRTVAEHPRTASLAEYADRRGDWLTRCAYLLTGSREDALDLAQDTLLLAWKSRERVLAADNLDGYVMRIMLNRFRSLHRKRRPFEVPLVLESALDAVADRTPGVDASDAVARALTHLSARQRAVIVLRYWADYDDQRIAEVLDCPRSTVRSLAARGMKKLESHLEAP